ncbi:MAG: 3-coathanger stack domain-containing protein [Bacteroidota bacterium]
MDKLIILFCSFCMTIGLLSAQCLPDAHNTDLNSGWISCSTSLSPNPGRGAGHWIVYDLTFEYFLEDLHIWNYNHPDGLDQGARTISVDISNDAQVWSPIGSYSLPRADGTPTYVGYDLIPNLNRRARYVLLSMENNYGAACTALGEVRIGIADETNCIEEYTLMGSLPSRKYRAHQSIEAQGVLPTNSVLHLQAQNEILLNQGFEASIASELEIEIGPCD